MLTGTVWSGELAAAVVGAARQNGVVPLYRDEAIVTRRDAHGMPTSSSSQPAIMAQMLGMLDVHDGHRVLEVGAGTGYNAALLDALAGPEGTVTTVDIDAETRLELSAFMQSAPPAGDWSPFQEVADGPAVSVLCDAADRENAGSALPSAAPKKSGPSSDTLAFILADLARGVDAGVHEQRGAAKIEARPRASRIPSPGMWRLRSPRKVASVRSIRGAKMPSIKRNIRTSTYIVS